MKGKQKGRVIKNPNPNEGVETTPDDFGVNESSSQILDREFGSDRGGKRHLSKHQPSIVHGLSTYELHKSGTTYKSVVPCTRVNNKGETIVYGRPSILPPSVRILKSNGQSGAYLNEMFSKVTKHKLNLRNKGKFISWKEAWSHFGIDDPYPTKEVRDRIMLGESELNIDEDEESFTPMENFVYWREEQYGLTDSSGEINNKKLNELIAHKISLNNQVQENIKIYNKFIHDDLKGNRDKAYKALSQIKEELRKNEIKEHFVELLEKPINNAKNSIAHDSGSDILNDEIRAIEAILQSDHGSIADTISDRFQRMDEEEGCFVPKDIPLQLASTEEPFEDIVPYLVEEIYDPVTKSVSERITGHPASSLIRSVLRALCRCNCQKNGCDLYDSSCFGSRDWYIPVSYNHNIWGVLWFINYTGMLLCRINDSASLIKFPKCRDILKALVILRGEGSITASFAMKSSSKFVRNLYMEKVNKRSKKMINRIITDMDIEMGLEEIDKEWSVPSSREEFQAQENLFRSRYPIINEIEKAKEWIEEYEKNGYDPKAKVFPRDIPIERTIVVDGIPEQKTIMKRIMVDAISELSYKIQEATKSGLAYKTIEGIITSDKVIRNNINTILWNKFKALRKKYPKQVWAKAWDGERIDLNTAEVPELQRISVFNQDLILPGIEADAPSRLTKFLDSRRDTPLKELSELSIIDHSITPEEVGILTSYDINSVLQALTQIYRGDNNTFEAIKNNSYQGMSVWDCNIVLRAVEFMEPVEDSQMVRETS